MARIIAVSALALFSLAIFACEASTNVGENAVDSSEADLALQEGWGWSSTEFGSRTLTGLVKNNTDKQYSYAQITFALFDADGVQVGSALDNVNDLQPNASWRFSALVLEDAATTARVTDITGF